MGFEDEYSEMFYLPTALRPAPDFRCLTFQDRQHTPLTYGNPQPQPEALPELGMVVAQQ